MRASLRCRFERWTGVLLLLAAMAATPGQAAAQAAEPLSSQKLGRPYLFVFVAYALVWAFVAGWVVSIALRLARVEKRLEGQ